MEFLNKLTEFLTKLTEILANPDKIDHLKKIWKTLLAILSTPILLAVILAGFLLFGFNILFSNPTDVILQWMIRAGAAILCSLFFWLFARWSGKLAIGLGVGVLITGAIIALVYLSPTARVAFDGFPTATQSPTSTAVLSTTLPTATPSPTVTQTPAYTATITPTVSSASRDASIVSISFRVNDHPVRIVDLRSADAQGIRVVSGDRLSFTELWFQNSGNEIEGARVNAEVYTNDEKIGKFETVDFRKGVHPLGKFIPSTMAAGPDPDAWVVQDNWQEVRIVLVIYKPNLDEERKSVDIRLSKDGDIGLVLLTPRPMLISIAYSVDGGSTQVVDIRKIKDQGIQVKPGQQFRVDEVWYQSDMDGTAKNTINIEMYLYQSGKTDGDHGNITKPSLIEVGRHPIGNFTGYEWSAPISKDTNGLVVRLILDGKTVIDEISVLFTENGGAELHP